MQTTPEILQNWLDKFVDDAEPAKRCLSCRHFSARPHNDGNPHSLHQGTCGLHNMDIMQAVRSHCPGYQTALDPMRQAATRKPPPSIEDPGITKKDFVRAGELLRGLAKRAKKTVNQATLQEARALGLRFFKRGQS